MRAAPRMPIRTTLMVHILPCRILARDAVLIAP
jgi:hypothetical protein